MFQIKNTALYVLCISNEDANLYTQPQAQTKCINTERCTAVTG